MQQQWYSPEEMAILKRAHDGDLRLAWSDLQATLPVLSPARSALVRAWLLWWESPANRSDAFHLLIGTIRDGGCDPATTSMLFVDASGVGYELNERRLMKELWLRYLQLPMRFPNHAALTYWRGSTLLNFANHHLRNMEYGEASELLGEALQSLSADAHQWCHRCMAFLLTVWCQVEMGCIEEAEAALAGAASADQDGRFVADRHLALSRVHMAVGRYDEAREAAVEAARVAGALARPDGQVITEASLERLRLSLITGVEDPLHLAVETTALGSRYGFGYIPWLVKRLLLKYGYGGREAL